MSSTNVVTTSGTSMGVALAVTLSYSANSHIGWAILHGIFSWLYVIYHAFKY